MRRRGLKRQWLDEKGEAVTSPPMRRRGLKLKPEVAIDHQREVASHAEAWIETAETT